MKYIQVYALLFMFVFCTSCGGQNKPDPSKEKVSESNKIPGAHPKLIKTIGNPRYGNVQCSMQDKAGNLWFGTTQNGLYKYDGKSFRQFLVADGLNSDNIFSIVEDKDGKIWIGTEAGLCLYDARLDDGVGQDKTFTQIQIPLRKDLPPNKRDLYRNSHWVFSIMQAKNGTLWFATINGVYTYDGKFPPTGQAAFTPFLVNEGSGGYVNSNNNVEYILEDKAGNIWFGGRSNEGVYRYDGKSVINIKLPELSTFRPDSSRVGHNWAWPQLQDKNGNIWFSNWGGVYRYDGKSFTSFTKNDGLAGAVTRIIEDKNGTLWFGGDGICRFDGSLNDEARQEKSFTCFRPKEGLANPGVWSILEDTSGDLWVGTRETGLYLFDGKTFIMYSEYKR